MSIDALHGDCLFPYLYLSLSAIGTASTWLSLIDHDDTLWNEGPGLMDKSSISYEWVVNNAIDVTDKPTVYGILKVSAVAGDPLAFM